MALVVFLRGVNVGGHKTFRPAEFVKELSGFRVTNIGAAGTFVVHEKVSRSFLREEFARRLPHKTEIMIVRGNEILELLRGKPFGTHTPARETKWYVTIFDKPPEHSPRLPLDFPAASDWRVRIVRVTGKFALSLCRRGDGTMIYPNEVCEKVFGVPATTRGWPTILSLAQMLQSL